MGCDPKPHEFMQQTSLSSLFFTTKNDMNKMRLFSPVSSSRLSVSLIFLIQNERDSTMQKKKKLKKAISMNDEIDIKIYRMSKCLMR